jgi:hypothetical protein
MLAFMPLYRAVVCDGDHKKGECSAMDLARVTNALRFD